MSFAGYILLFQIMVLFVTLGPLLFVRNNVRNIINITRIGIVIFSLLSLVVVIFINTGSFSSLSYVDSIFYGLDFSFIAKIFISFNIVSGFCSMIYLSRVNSNRVFKYVVMMLLGLGFTNLIILQSSVYIAVVLLELLFVPLIINSIMAGHKRFSFRYIFLTTFIFIGLAISFDERLFKYFQFDSTYMSTLIFICLVMAIAFKGIIFKKDKGIRCDEELELITDIFRGLIYTPAVIVTMYTLLLNFNQLLLTYSDVYYRVLLLVLLFLFLMTTVSVSSIEKRRFKGDISYIIVLMGLWLYLVDKPSSSSALAASLYIYMAISLSSFMLNLLSRQKQEANSSSYIIKLIKSSLEGNLGIFPPFGIFIGFVIFASEVYRINVSYGLFLIVILLSLPLFSRGKDRNVISGNVLMMKEVKLNSIELLFVILIAFFSLTALFFISKDLLLLL